MGQLGFFDLENRYAGLDAHGDPLVAINSAVPFEVFRLKLKTALIEGGLRGSDAKTLWLYREALAKAGAVEKLFNLFNGYLRTRAIWRWAIRSSMPPSFLHRASATRAMTMRR